jgi:hypothetical protein
MTHSLTCTFCRKSEHQVRKLVAGPGVYICDACIETAHAIIHETSAPPPISFWRRAVSRLPGRLGALASNWQRLGAINSPA